MKGSQYYLFVLLCSFVIATGCNSKVYHPSAPVALTPSDPLAVELTWTCDARDSCGRCIRATCNAKSLRDIALNNTCIDLAAQCMASGHRWEGVSTIGSCTMRAPLDFECPN
ncbi:hypothetical protein MIB92_14425 [Aestuariirhabdus sp. Z084]|uniref:hypothetical protein n=1 Tax=Aestuariirhabdus haliotis TaxID=2918751 RepID=UPI00201B3C4E|nr:hypothetical protein [Aestuariirhabdus haliotis]MCL6416853.1 hypothetical protein [Aestuariirhabdus haliotis]MCL6420871.1 hypothetical protein [Aestuariirhabdus haliotis]